MSSEESRGRPRLNLKPRDEAAAAKAAEERAKATKSNPFGQAKPRESILADRSGRKEEDILRDELSKDRLRLRLTPEQSGQQQLVEAEIHELEEAAALEEDGSKKAVIGEELSQKKTELSAMLAEFEKLAVARAKSGEGIRPSERRRLAEERELGNAGAPMASRGAYGSGEYGYGSGASAEPYGTRVSKQGSYGLGSGQYSGPLQSRSSGGDYRPANGAGNDAYSQPQAQGYEKGLPDGFPGAHDIFAAGQGDSYGGRGPIAARGQDRF